MSTFIHRVDRSHWTPYDIACAVEQWPDRWRDDFEELAAILEWQQGWAYVPAVQEAYAEMREAARRAGVSLPEATGHYLLDGSLPQSLLPAGGGARRKRRTA